MKKPKKHTLKYYDYLECGKYIATSLGVEDLDNFAGKTFGDGGKPTDNLPYQDFWDFLIDHSDGGNRRFVTIGSWLLEGIKVEPWQAGIVQAFIEKFGDNQQYWACW